jgi:hypothetical protein
MATAADVSLITLPLQQPRPQPPPQLQETSS